jgi:hypothetical protein
MDLFMLWAASFVLCLMTFLFGCGVKVLLDAWMAHRANRRSGWPI